MDNRVMGHVSSLGLYFLTYGRLNNAVSSSGYKVSNGRMINPYRSNVELS